MFTFKFDLESQKNRYLNTQFKIKNRDFYQRLNFYVLPFMPEKFRGRVVFFPERFEPELIYKKQKNKIQKLENDFNNIKSEFSKKLKEFFPEIETLDIAVSPSLYGTVGSYNIEGGEVQVFPRYDRTVNNLQKLIVTALIHHYRYEPASILDKNTDRWKQKQEDAAKIEKLVIISKKSKSFVKILDTEFAGKLAEESAKYLEKLKSPSRFEVDKPENLTRSERDVMNLLLRNKNKLVTFDQIAEEIWREKAYEKYSEYAITTIIKKLKKKLQQKTDKHIIQAQRGVGYILHT